jgi:hypothetical protein
MKILCFYVPKLSLSEKQKIHHLFEVFYLELRDNVDVLSILRKEIERSCDESTTPKRR